MLDIGKRAPEFNLEDQDDKHHTLQSLLGKGPLILYFYPADFTPGCTKEACTFRDLQKDLVQAKLRVVGISPQDAASHQRFAAKHQLNFPLLVDPDKKTVRAYDLDGPLGIGVRRGTYLIGTDGLIKDSVLADFQISKHEAFVERAVKFGAQEK